MTLILNSTVSIVPVLCAAADKVTQLKEVVVTAQKDKNGIDFKEGVEGAKIYSGKKATTIELMELPTVTNNNYRQVLQKTPGLLIAEESTPLFSAGYRGLNPDRGQYLQVMKDGIPIVADVIGYPEAYYTPSLQVVDHIDFVRGGSALMYGPQPGGAINYVTKDPYPSAFNLVIENSFGSHDTYSHTTSLSGTQGPWGHYSYFQHRQSQGFRDSNSQFEVNYGGSKVIIERDPTSKWTLAFDLYEETHGEPGGLTRTDFDTNPSLTSRLMDHFELNRYYGSVSYAKEVSEGLFYDLKVFGGQYERFSWRQRGGGFGTLPSGAAGSTNDIQRQEFATGGADLRMRREYDAWGSQDHVLSAGIFYYHSDSPRIEERGTEPDAVSGVLRKDSDRTSDYLSVFLENLFRFGKLSVTPGVRFENIWQSIQEKTNADKTTVPLADNSDYEAVPLFGVGANDEITDSLDVYGNVSQSYRPKVYADAAPLGTNQVINADLNEGHSWQAEAGLKGKPTGYFSWDTSVFFMAFDDQTGTVGNTIQNVGDAEVEGAEAAVELDLIGLCDAIRGAKRKEEWGSLNLFFNGTFLDAEFVGGPNTGKIPQYAPDTILRAGVEFEFKNRNKVRLASTFVDGHFGDDSNLDQRILPSYKVWDLTAEHKVYKEISLFGGINNLFDEHYFSRVTSGGIDPADGRNYYAGLKFIW